MRDIRARVKARLVPFDGIVGDSDLKPARGDVALMFSRGELAIVDSYAFICPGCGNLSCVEFIHNGMPNQMVWTVSAGVVFEPEGVSLSPSIRHNIGACGWHGYLTRGVFEPCL